MRPFHAGSPIRDDVRGHGRKTRGSAATLGEETRPAMNELRQIRRFSASVRHSNRRQSEGHPSNPTRVLQSTRFRNSYHDSPSTHLPTGTLRLHRPICLPVSLQRSHLVCVATRFLGFLASLPYISDEQPAYPLLLEGTLLLRGIAALRALDIKSDKASRTVEDFIVSGPCLCRITLVVEELG